MKRVFIFLIFVLLCYTSSYGIKPAKEYAFTPNDIQAEYEEKQIKTSDGYVIHSWHIFPQSGTDKKNSMIISYGDSGNMANWLGMASLLSQAGYDVWLYDYRGFGQSSDFKMNNDQLYYNEFLYDLSAVVNVVKANKPDNQLTLLGFSMGTIISLIYLHQHPDDVNYYIAEGIVYSPEKIIGKLRSINGRNLVLPNAEVKIEDLYSTAAATPTLIFVASNDLICDKEDIKAIIQKLKSVKVVNYEGGHLAGLMVLQDQYIQHINDFLERPL